jgi:hypothetical protein
LDAIKRLQADGHTLLDIGRILSGPSAAKSAIEPLTAVAARDRRRRHRVGERTAPGRGERRKLRAAVEEFARRVRPEKKAKVRAPSSAQWTAHGSVIAVSCGASAVYGRNSHSPRAGVPQDQSAGASEGCGFGRLLWDWNCRDSWSMRRFPQCRFRVNSAHFVRTVGLPAPQFIRKSSEG